jgi:chaperonin cofactor prefoldin
LLKTIAEMLRKLNEHSETLELQNEALQKQEEVLTAFMEGSLKQFV